MISANALLNNAILIHMYLTIPFVVCLGVVLVPSRLRFLKENLKARNRHTERLDVRNIGDIHMRKYTLHTLPGCLLGN